MYFEHKFGIDCNIKSKYPTHSIKSNESKKNYVQDPSCFPGSSYWEVIPASCPVEVLPNLTCTVPPQYNETCPNITVLPPVLWGMQEQQEAHGDTPFLVRFFGCAPALCNTPKQHTLMAVFIYGDIFFGFVSSSFHTRSMLKQKKQK